MTIYSEDPTQNIQCTKANLPGSPTLGVLVFGDLTVLNLFGTKLHWDGWTSCDSGVNPSSIDLTQLITGGQFSNCD